MAAIILSVSAIYFINSKLMNPTASAEKINWMASDGKKIAADFYPVKNLKAWLLLTHMMPATKESWDDFAKSMQESGYASLALDLRGHGESEGGPDGYQKFSDAEHQAGIRDLEAGWEFLKSQGAVPEKLTVIGASIGANLSLQFLTVHPEIAGGVLLSPGDYKGIDSGALVKKLDANQKIIFAASRLDERSAGNPRMQRAEQSSYAGNNAEDNQRYYNSAAQVKNRHLILFDGAGHGTDLFLLEKEYNLIEAIRKFISNGTIN